MTGRFAVWAMTFSMTNFGYVVSDLEIMSFVPRAMTMAVVERVRLFLRTTDPAFAVRPTLASIVAFFQVPSARSFDPSEPNASVPTVRLSPITRRVPCPFGPTAEAFRLAETMV